jgi:5-(carboxyamino)imidazole ribonucleotide synthase
MTIGVLGGGQLGRMLALSGVPLGKRFLFVDPSRESCAAHVGELLVGAYDDEKTLSELARRSEVVTFEFENVELAAANYLAELVPVFPPPRALQVSQDRLLEKDFFGQCGISTPSYASVNSLDGLRTAAARLGLPIVVKTRRFGYDGKGQFRIRSEADVDVAWSALGKGALIAESWVPFTREISVIGARTQSGEIAIYPIVENTHKDGVLRSSRVRLSDPAQAEAESILTKALNALNYVGVLTIELFDCNGALVANEMAPRVHNSGHITIEASETSQFENHIRAILGVPLGSTQTREHAAMLNILGPHPALEKLLQVPNAHVHLYGKSAIEGRKCGHVSVVAASAEALQKSIEHIERLLTTLNA